VRFGLTLFQHSFLVLLGESDVKMRSPMSVHEFETVDLEFCAAEPVGGFCNIREPQNPILERFVQTEACRTGNIS
jgi:hypothetical protein